MLPPHISLRETKSLLLIAALAAATTAHSQRVEQPAINEETAPPSKVPVKVETTASTGEPANTPKPGDEEIVEMSVFTVTASDDDRGYQALRTTSGSRL
jgi:hypothetical protein